MTAHQSPDRPNTVLLAVILSATVALGPMTINLYLPALPSIATALSADANQVQRTLSIYMIGFAFSQLIYGPLSDRFGRKPVLLAGVGIFIMASIACALAQNIDQLIAYRFLQAVGAACGPVLGRTVVRDYFVREEAAHILSWVTSVMALAPILAPMFGGLIVTWSDWRMNFWVLATYAGILAITVMLCLGESNRHKDPTATNLRPMLRNFGMMLRHRAYVGFLITNVFAFAGVFAGLIGSSFVLIDRMGMSPLHYGLAFGIVSLGFLAGAQTAARLVRRFGLERICLAGTSCTAIGGFSILALLWSGMETPVSVIAPITVYYFGMGMAVPTIQAGAVAPFKYNAGAASSLIGVFQYTAAGGATLLLGNLGFDPTLLMATMMGVAGVGALASFTFLVWIPTRHHVAARKAAGD